VVSGGSRIVGSSEVTLGLSQPIRRSIHAPASQGRSVTQGCYILIQLAGARSLQVFLGFRILRIDLEGFLESHDGLVHVALLG